MHLNRCTHDMNTASQAAFGRGQHFEAFWPGYCYWFSDGVPALVS